MSLNWILERVKESISNDELTNLLLGEKNYFFPNRELPDDHNFGVILYSGIYEYFNIDVKIKQNFENALLALIHGSDYDLLVAFEYIWRQISCEERGSAPFKIDTHCVVTLKNEISSREQALKCYKNNILFKWSHIGTYEYINNIIESLEKDYGINIFNV